MKRSFEESEKSDQVNETIVFITGNVGKLREVNQILNENLPKHISLEITNHSVDLPELQGTPESICTEKCKHAASLTKSATLIEDTCLYYNALNGLPGPYIKWFMDIGLKGLHDLLCGFEDKSAYALATFAYTDGPDKPVHLFEGRVDGNIVLPRGKEGFGWDPIFEPIEANGKTFGELKKEEKNHISHRRRALEKLQNFLIQRNQPKETEKEKEASLSSPTEKPSEKEASLSSLTEKEKEASLKSSTEKLSEKEKEASLSSPTEKPSEKKEASLSSRTEKPSEKEKEVAIKGIPLGK